MGTIVTGKGTVPVSGPGVRASLAVSVPGASASSVVLLSLGERDNENDTRGAMDFYAIPTTDVVTIYAQDQELPEATDVYFLVDLDGTGLGAGGFPYTVHDQRRRCEDSGQVRGLIFSFLRYTPNVGCGEEGV